MSDAADYERFTTTIDLASAEKIRLLAERMNCSPSKMASMLLEAGLQENEWLINLVTSRVVKGLLEALKAKDRPRRSEKTAAL